MLYHIFQTNIERPQLVCEFVIDHFEDLSRREWNYHKIFFSPDLFSLSSGRFKFIHIANNLRLLNKRLSLVINQICPYRRLLVNKDNLFHPEDKNRSDFANGGHGTQQLMIRLLAGASEEELGDRRVKKKGDGSLFCGWMLLQLFIFTSLIARILRGKNYEIALCVHYVTYLLARSPPSARFPFAFFLLGDYMYRVIFHIADFSKNFLIFLIQNLMLKVHYYTDWIWVWLEESGSLHDKKYIYDNGFLIFNKFIPCTFVLNSRSSLRFSLVVKYRV